MYTTLLAKAQNTLCRLPRDVHDKPATSPLAQIPLRRFPRNFSPRTGKFGEVGVMEFGLVQQQVVMVGLARGVARDRSKTRQCSFIPFPPPHRPLSFIYLLPLPPFPDPRILFPPIPSSSLGSPAHLNSARGL